MYMAPNSNPSSNPFEYLPDLHQIPLNLERAAFIQATWGEILLHHFPAVPFCHPSYRWIAAVDVAYPPDPNPQWGVACAVLWDNLTHQLTQWTTYQGPTLFPYTPGFLAFREALLMEHALIDLPHPLDLILTDGHGLLHPRGFGEAVHVGALLHIPSIGVGKSSFFGRSAWHQLPRLHGAHTPIWKPEPPTLFHTSPDYFITLPTLLGYAVCLCSDCSPVFVSPGFQIGTDAIIPLILSLSNNHRLPEPLYCADYYAQQSLNSTLTKKNPE
jgi:deoxyribonuclease V